MSPMGQSRTDAFAAGAYPPRMIIELYRPDFPDVLRNCNSLIITPGLPWCGGTVVIEETFGLPWSNAAGCSIERMCMRLVHSFAAAMLMTVLLPVLHAHAFTSDPTSGMNPDGSPRFVDPDDQIHSLFSGGSGLNEYGWADRNSASRNAFPSPGGVDQGVTFPNWFFPTSPRR
jgi:hypothetical protein